MPVPSNPETNPSAPNPEGREPSRRGGCRPGAGAPKGNLNALKHGRRSAQFAELGVLLASIPQARDALLALARRHQLKQRRAEDVAALLLQRLLEHTHQIQDRRTARKPQIQNRRLNVQSPIPERRTIKKSDPNTPSAQYAGRPKREFSLPIYQTPNLRRPALSNFRYEKPVDCPPPPPVVESAS